MRISVKAKRNLQSFEQVDENEFLPIDKWRTTDGQEPWVEIDENEDAEEFWNLGAEVIYYICHNFKLRNGSELEFSEQQEDVLLHRSRVRVTVGYKNGNEVEGPGDVLERLRQCFTQTEIVVRHKAVETWPEQGEYEREGY